LSKEKKSFTRNNMKKSETVVNLKQKQIKHQKKTFREHLDGIILDQNRIITTEGSKKSISYTTEMTT